MSNNRRHHYKHGIEPYIKGQTHKEYAQSRARYIQRERDEAERRKRINPRFVFVDPDAFFDDLMMEQNETA